MAMLGRRFDIQIGGKGFMMARGEFKGRAWRRSGRSDAPGMRSQADAEYGTLPDELDHPEVWNDWTGGFGYAYRETGQPTYHWAENFDARFPRQLIHVQAPFDYSTAPSFNLNGINAFFDTFPVAAEASRIGGGRIMHIGDGLVQWFSPETNYSMRLDIFQTTPTLNYGYRPAIFGSYMYLPNLDGSAFMQYGLDSILTGTAQGGMPAMGFAVAGDRLWRFHGPSGKRIYVQSCAAGADPTLTANWSATITIGNGIYDINDMITVGDQLFVGTPDGMYAGDQTGTFFNVLPELVGQRHQGNCRALQPYGGGILTPYRGGIFYYQQLGDGYSAQVRDIGPSRTSSRSPINGWITALESRGQWAYAGVWNGSQSYLIAGSERGSDFVWHSLHTISNDLLTPQRAISRIHIDTITTVSGSDTQIVPHMWIGFDKLSSNKRHGILAIPIPPNDANPLAGGQIWQSNGTPKYIGSARIDLGAVDWGSPGTPKILRDVEVWANNLASGTQWCQVYYDVDQSGSFTLLGTIAKSPKDTLYFPSGEGSFVTGQNVELSLRSFTASAGVTPVYRSLVLRGALQARSVDLITAVVRIGDGIRDRQNGEMRSGATMLKELRDFANPDAQGLQAHQLIDLAGATQWVKVLPPIEEAENYQKGDDYPEVAATVKMAVLVFS